MDPMSPFQFRLLTRVDDPPLIEFLDSVSSREPWILGYHYPFYREMLVNIGAGEPLYASAWRNGELLAVLPGFLKRTIAGSAYCSLPFFGPNAGVLPKSRDCAAEVQTALLNYVIQLLKDCYPDLLSAVFYSPFLFDEGDLYRQALPDAIDLEKVTQYLDLHRVAWSKSIRYDLRKAESSGVFVSEETTSNRLEALYEIYRQNCLDYGIPQKPLQAITYLVGQGQPEKKVRCYFALRDQTLLGGLIAVWSSSVASYYLPCTLSEARSLHPGTYLADFAIRDAQRHGLRFWNWEASPGRESGVFAFKKKWGSLESSYRIYVLPFQPDKVFKTLGRKQLVMQFPYYFVYPFERLADVKEGEAD